MTENSTAKSGDNPDAPSEEQLIENGGVRFDKLNTINGRIYCTGCGRFLHGLHEKPVHDGNKNFYMTKRCPFCDAVAVRIYPAENMELTQRLQQVAKLDPKEISKHDD